MPYRPRVLFEANGSVKVSQPNVNVYNARLDQTIFDSRFAAFGQAQTNTIQINPRNSLGANPVTEVVLFGVDYITPPMFMFGWYVNSINTDLKLAQIYGFQDHTYGRMKQVDAEVTRTRATFKNWYMNLDANKIIVKWKAIT